MIDEPVRRHLTHAIAEGAPLNSGALLAMEGRIRAGRWLEAAGMSAERIA